ncbi:hypothetical protein ACQJBY_041578 [Aegilops geniculata]
MRSTALQWTAATWYRTVKLACCKRRVSSEQKGIRRLDRPIQHRGLVSPRPSFRTLACTGRPSDDMDKRWTHICSSAFSAKQGDMMGQVQDYCPSSNLELGSAYPGGLSEKEIERRQKISAANKGKAPWTKGRKLTQEHRQRIKQGTIQALRDPKVKKKMLGHRQLHRQSSKDKISAALRKVWERRMISVRSRQMILRIWSDSIAEAAKEGDHGQDKLDWDSYDKIQSEMLSVFLWNKEKEQVTKKLKRVVKKIVAKKLQAAEKMELLTKRTKKAKPEKLVLQKSDAQPRRVLASTRPKLKERLTKLASVDNDQSSDGQAVLRMRSSKTNGSVQKAGRVSHAQGEGPSWVLVAGGVLLSTLSVRFGCKLKQMFDTKKQNTSTSRAKRRHGSCELHSNLYRFDDETNCYCCVSDGGVEIKQGPASSLSKPDEPSLPLAKIPGPESSKENSGVMWTSSPDRLEDHRRPLQYSNSSGSPCVSESGSDIYIKREVIQKLRQHLRRRDEMIMEMQAQIADLKNSLSIEETQTANLQSQLDGANRDLFESEREIQQLRKIIADHCVAEALSRDKPLQAGNWQPDAANGHANGYADSSIDDPELRCIGIEKRNGEAERVEMLKREVGELKEVIEGKDFLLQSYKEQKVELCSKMRELQERLSAQVPNIL